MCLQASGDTALHICARAGGLNEAVSSECLAMLIGLGASLDLPNKARNAMTIRRAAARSHAFWRELVMQHIVDMLCKRCLCSTSGNNWNSERA